MSEDLDDVDRAIVYHLSREARHTTATEIADDVRVSAQTVRNRIERLEESGVIRGYHAHVDFERAGDMLTNLFVCTASAGERERLAREALRVPGVVSVREVMTGHGDLHVTAVAEDTDAITRIARALTDLGIEIEQEDLVKRHHVGAYHRYAPDAERRETTITDFLTLTGDAELVELSVTDDAPVAGTTLGEATSAGLLPEDALVVAVERDRDALTPNGETELRAGDTVTVLSRRGIDALASAFDFD